MKIRTMVVSALAALAVSGVFAAGASAEQAERGTYTLDLCEPMDPAQEAYLFDPSRTEQESREAWDAYILQSCAVLQVPMSEMDAVNLFIDACLEPYMPNLSKAEAEACVAAWNAQSGVETARHRKAKRRHHKHKRHPHAKIALGRTLAAS
jgi:hypothetical protein